MSTCILFKDNVELRREQQKSDKTIAALRKENTELRADSHDRDSIIEDQRLSLAKRAEDIIDLKKQNNKLITKVEQLERASKRQAAPFRREEKEKKKKKKKSGRKKGHKGAHREFTGEPDQTIEEELESCPHCGHDKFYDVDKTEQIVQDIVAYVVTTKLITYKGNCCHCHQEVQTDHPLKISNATGAAGTYIGPTARALAIALKYRYGLSMSNTVGVLDDIFGLKLTAGGLAQMSHKAAEVMKDGYDDVLEAMRKSKVAYMDETSWYVGNPDYWLWVLTNKDHTLYHVIDSRARQVIYDLIEKDYKGVLVSDCLAIYDDVNKVQQKCYSHHLKALKIAREAASGHAEDLQLIQALKSILTQAIQIKKVRDEVSTSRYKTGIKNLEKQADKLIPPLNEIEEHIKKGHYDQYLESTIRVLKRLARQKDHLFTFLYYDYVDATNNLAERQLRPAVISRKISCGNKTMKGAETWKVLTSLIQTSKQQNESFTQNLTESYYRHLHEPAPT